MLDLSKLLGNAPEGQTAGISGASDKIDVKTAKAPENALNDDIEVCEEVPLDNVAGWIKEKRIQEDQRAAMKLEQLQTNAARCKFVYREYQDNIKRASCLRENINLEAKAGAAPEDLLLMAVECIALMTGDGLFLDSFKSNMAKRSATNTQDAI